MGLTPEKIEVQKTAAQNSLAERQAQLRAKGLDDRALARDPLIRKAKAAIRQATRRLARVAELDEQSAELAKAKADGGAKPDEGKKKKEGGEKKQKKQKED